MKGGRSNGFLIELSAPGLQCRGNTTHIHKRCAPPHWGLGSILGARRLTMQCFNHHAHPLMVGWRSVQTSKGACWKHSRCQSAQFACFGVANRVPKEITRRGFLLPTYPSWPQRPAPRRPPASLDELAWSPCYVRLKHVRKTAFRLRPVVGAAALDVADAAAHWTVVRQTLAVRVPAFAPALGAARRRSRRRPRATERRRRVAIFSNYLRSAIMPPRGNIIFDFAIAKWPPKLASLDPPPL